MAGTGPFDAISLATLAPMPAPTTTPPENATTAEIAAVAIATAR
jgi:hypothetical protein